MVLSATPLTSDAPLSTQERGYHWDNTGNSIKKNLFNGTTYFPESGVQATFSNQRLKKNGDVLFEKDINDGVIELFNNERIRAFFNLLKKAEESFKTIENEDVRNYVLIESIKHIINSSLSNVVFEKTPDDSVLIKAKSGEYNFYLEVFEDEEAPLGHEAIINVYEKGKNVLLSSGLIEELFSKLKTILSK